MDLITNNIGFGLVLTYIAFKIGIKVKKRFAVALANPLLIGIVTIIAFLLLFDIPYENYKSGGDVIHFFLGPATVILAVPLYRQIKELKKNMLPILTGVLIGSLSALVMVAAASKFAGLEPSIAASLMPKSVTMPIGLELSEALGGVTAITVISIVVTGLTGAVFAEKTVGFFKIKNEVAQGIGIGTSAHALGTTKAVEMGEVQGGMSGLAIGLTGIFTAILAPFIYRLFF